MRAIAMMAAVVALTACSGGDDNGRAAMYEQAVDRIEERLEYLAGEQNVESVHVVADGSRNHIVLAFVARDGSVPDTVAQVADRAGADVFLGEVWAVEAPFEGEFPPAEYICIQPEIADAGHEMVMTHCE